MSTDAYASTDEGDGGSTRAISHDLDDDQDVLPSVKQENQQDRVFTAAPATSVETRDEMTTDAYASNDEAGQSTRFTRQDTEERQDDERYKDADNEEGRRPEVEYNEQDDDTDMAADSFRDARLLDRRAAMTHALRLGSREDSTIIDERTSIAEDEIEDFPDDEKPHANAGNVTTGYATSDDEEDSVNRVKEEEMVASVLLPSIVTQSSPLRMATYESEEEYDELESMGGEVDGLAISRERS